MFELMVLALALGIKHSFDADHIVAVSNLLTKARNMKNALKLGVSWAFGHMITASLITFLLFTYKESVLPIILGQFEQVVAIMLLVLGLASLNSARLFHIHKHVHNGKKHIHPHMHLNVQKNDHSHKHIFGIGIMHGLASNDELLLLLTVSIGASSLLEMVYGVAFFSIGVVLGMVLFSAIFMLPILNVHTENLRRVVSGCVGGISIIYGIMLLAGI